MRKTVLLSLGALMIVAGGAGAAWYLHLRNSPQYALRQLAEAVAAKDELAFEMYFDTKRVAQSIADDFVNSALEKTTRRAANGSGFEALGAMLGAQMLQGMKPALASMIEASIHSAVRGDPPPRSTSRILDGAPDLRRFREAFKGIDRIEQRQDLALVRMRIKPEDADTAMVVTVRMERSNGVWRVVGVENIAEQLQAQQVNQFENAYLASMKSDLRNLVTAEEAYFADSVKYTTNLGTSYMTTSGVTGPRIALTPDGFTAWVGSAHTSKTCAIYVGAVPLPPAVREGEPRCSDGRARSREPRSEDPYVASMKSDLRNLIVAEEAYFADSVKYTSNLGAAFATTAGVTGPSIRLTSDGFTAWVGSGHITTRCAIFVGSVPLSPARYEGVPQCEVDSPSKRD